MEKKNQIFCIANYHEYLDCWKVFKDKLPLYFSYIEVKCKYCNSQKIVRYGLYKGVQRWWCNQCKRKFVHNEALPGMKTPLPQIESALRLYYQGGAVNSIRKQMDKDFGFYPSDSTLYGWIKRFNHHSIEEIKNYTPVLGDVWAISALKLKGKKYWLMDILDTRTLFLLSAKIALHYNLNSIRQLTESAVEIAKKTPDKILVNGWKGDENESGPSLEMNGREVQLMPFNKEYNLKLVQNWQEIHRIIQRILHGKNSRSMQLIINGWLIYYNFSRHNQLISGRTPAQESGLTLRPVPG